MNILIVEDEKNIALTLSEYLRESGHVVKLAKSVRETYLLLEEKFKPHLILLDIMLPDGSGFDIAQKIYKKYSKQEIKIIFLSALNDPETRVKGLELGAYEYISKPFSLKEIKIRINRIEENIPHIFDLNDLTIDFDQFLITNKTGESKNIGSKEKEILEILVKNIDRVVSRDKILLEVWGEDKYPSNRTIDNYIVQIRKIFEQLSTHLIEIESIRAVGYKLKNKNLIKE